MGNPKRVQQTGIKLKGKQQRELALALIHSALNKVSELGKKEGALVAAYIVPVAQSWAAYRKELANVPLTKGALENELAPGFKAKLSSEQLFHINHYANGHLVRIEANYKKVDEVMKMLLSMFDQLGEEMQDECIEIADQ